MTRAIRHRGLYVRRDRPFGAGNGVLAVATTLDGVRLPAGTEIARDEDFDFVMATLPTALTVAGVELPPGTVLSLYRARPRGRRAQAMRALLAPFAVGGVVALATVELATGAWRPWERRAAGPGVRMIAWLPGDAVPKRAIRFFDDGSIVDSGAGEPGATG